MNTHLSSIAKSFWTNAGATLHICPFRPASVLICSRALTDQNEEIDINQKRTPYNHATVSFVTSEGNGLLHGRGLSQCHIDSISKCESNNVISMLLSQSVSYHHSILDVDRWWTFGSMPNTGVCAPSSKKPMVSRWAIWFAVSGCYLKRILLAWVQSPLFQLVWLSDL